MSGEIVAEGIVRAVQEWLPGIEPNDLEFIRLLLLEGDPEKLWRCRVYRYDDGRTYDTTPEDRLRRRVALRRASARHLSIVPGRRANPARSRRF